MYNFFKKRYPTIIDPSNKFYITYKIARSMLQAASLLDQEEKIEVYTRNPDNSAKKAGNMREISEKYIEEQKIRKQKIETWVNEKNKLLTEMEKTNLAIKRHTELLKELNEDLRQQKFTFTQTHRKLQTSLLDNPATLFDKYFVLNLPEALSDPRKLPNPICEDNNTSTATPKFELR